ncbi:AraC family transcriptional regulator [uncultured Hydrogenophaga sp.]|uniref:AraC family transcriptional regulator n=1 Tax=uncultured Hydrogenophaga sp. TaxID=199683 RepID=UPI00265FB2EB|nr:AraC family transcriptional regulator [uncultured Hydrogenophaga sp.]
MIETPESILRGPALTPISLVRAMVMAYRRRGIDPAAALATAQIDPGRLEDPSARITAAQMERVSEAAMRELDDEALGCFARPLPWGSYGMLARASLSAPTLGLALKRWCRHHGLIAPDATLTLSRQDQEARLTLTLHREPDPMDELCVVSVLRNIHGLASWYADSRIPLRQVQLPYPAPPHVAAYGALFDAPVLFDASAGALEFHAQYLDLPVRRDEAAMTQLLQRALPLTVRSFRRDRLLVQRVRQVLADHPEKTHSAEGVAALLHTSVRSLHRQLQTEGASLQSLKDEVRLQRASELLLRTSRPIKQVAEAAGFRNEKSFARAFRAWTGRTPSEWRQPGQTPPA